MSFVVCVTIILVPLNFEHPKLYQVFTQLKELWFKRQDAKLEKDLLHINVRYFV